LVRQLLFGAYPKLLVLLLVAAAVAAALNARAVVRRLAALTPKSARIALSLILLAGAALRIGRPPRHEVFYDEYEHADIAANVARTGNFAETLAGGRPDLGIYDLPSWPGAFHTTLGLILKLGGDAERSAFRFNAIVGTLTLPLVFAAAALSFSNAWAGLAAAALWALWPDHVRLSAAGDLTAFAIFWLSATLLAAAWLEEKRDASAAWLLSLCAAVAVNSRFENAALLPFVALLLLRARKSGALALLLLAALPPLALMSLNRGAGIPGFTPSLGESARSLASNLLGDLRLGRLDWLWAAALAAFAALDRKNRRAAAALASVSLLYLLGTSAFYRGVMAGPQARYSLAVLLPLALAAGAGAAALTSRAGRPALGALLTAAFGLSLRPWASAPDTANHAQDRFVHDAAPSLPQGPLVLSYSAPAILIAAKRAAASPLTLQDAVVADAAQAGLIVFEDWAWRENAAASGLDADLKRRFSWSKLSAGGTPDKPAAFYVLTQKP
jgi:hypothetical protein